MSHEHYASGNEVTESFQNFNINEQGEEGVHTEEEYAQAQLTLRAIVSTKEAGVIIGKAGKNVADLRDETGVKAGVSKVVQNVMDRVLTVTGTLEGVSKAYSMVVQTLIDSPPGSIPGHAPPGSHTLRLLISHNQMGTIIGRQGSKIKYIQDVSGVRMMAQKDKLPNSTERIAEVTGNQEGIRLAIWEIGKCLVDDWQRGSGTILYDPANNTMGRSNGGGYSTSERSGGNRSYTRTGNGADFAEPYSRKGPRSSNDRISGGGGGGGGSIQQQIGEDGEEFETQNISIPADMVGCIIGRGGAKISEIRRSSGARISIAKAPHDDSGERMFTITGSAAANERALNLLYENLETEKQRRSSQTQE